MSSEVLVVHCGLLSYGDARTAQRRLEAVRQEEAIPDVLMLLEHPPVYTRGRRSTAEELPMGAE
ncbi:MAG: lipoate-protein ligase B, partial [Solirubrobacterales bacterium]